MTDKICCNCQYYDGVTGVQGCAPCSRDNKMVLWNDTCDTIWLVRKRLETGSMTNADRIKAMSAEELAVFLDAIVHDWCEGTATINGVEPIIIHSWLDWLKEEVTE